VLRLLSVLLLAALVGQLAISYSELPDIIATHFDGNGFADGWTSKSMFTATTVCIGLLVFAVLGGFPGLSRQMAVSLMSISKKAYWLAPERESETWAFLDRHLSLIRILSLGFLMLITRAVIQANKVSPPQVSAHVSWLSLLFLAVLFVWVLFLFWRFARA